MFASICSSSPCGNSAASVSRRPIRSISSFVTLLALAVLVSVSTAAAGDPVAVQSFRLLSLAGSYGGLYYEMNGSPKLNRITLDQVLSAYYPRATGQTLEIFREFPVPPGSPPGTKPVRKPAIKASIPQNVSRCVIVTIPNSTRRTDLLTSFVLPDDSPDHHAETVLFANYSSFPAMVAMDDDRYPVPVGGSKIIPYKANVSEFIVRIALQKHGGWTYVYKSEFSANRSLRGYVIFADYVPDPDYNRSAIPPPASVTAVFEMSPEVPRLVKKLPADKQGAVMGRKP